MNEKEIETYKEFKRDLEKLRRDANRIERQKLYGLLNGKWED